MDQQQQIQVKKEKLQYDNDQFLLNSYYWKVFFFPLFALRKSYEDIQVQLNRKALGDIQIQQEGFEQLKAAGEEIKEKIKVLLKQMEENMRFVFRSFQKQKWHQKHYIRFPNFTKKKISLEEAEIIIRVAIEEGLLYTHELNFPTRDLIVFKNRGMNVVQFFEEPYKKAATEEEKQRILKFFELYINHECFNFHSYYKFEALNLFVFPEPSKILPEFQKIVQKTYEEEHKGFFSTTIHGYWCFYKNEKKFEKLNLKALEQKKISFNLETKQIYKLKDETHHLGYYSDTTEYKNIVEKILYNEESYQYKRRNRNGILKIDREDTEEEYLIQLKKIEEENSQLNSIDNEQKDDLEDNNNEVIEEQEQNINQLENLKKQKLEYEKLFEQQLKEGEKYFVPKEIEVLVVEIYNEKKIQVTLDKNLQEGDLEILSYNFEILYPDTTDTDIQIKNKSILASERLSINNEDEFRENQDGTITVILNLCSEIKNYYDQFITVQVYPINKIGQSYKNSAFRFILGSNSFQNFYGMLIDQNKESQEFQDLNHLEFKKLVKSNQKICSIKSGQEQKLYLTFPDTYYLIQTGLAFNVASLDTIQNIEHEAYCPLVSYNFMLKIKVNQIDVGNNFCALLSSQGEVYTWGTNQFGQLGTEIHDEDAIIDIPQKVKYFERNYIFVKMISVGNSHCLALEEKGTVYEWGNCKIPKGGSECLELLNRFGEPTNILSLNREQEFQKEPIQVQRMPSDVVKICAGNSEQYFISEDNFEFGFPVNGVITKGGQLYMWGDNSQKQQILETNQIFQELNDDFIKENIQYTYFIYPQPVDLQVSKNQPDLQILDFSCKYGYCVAACKEPKSENKDQNHFLFAWGSNQNQIFSKKKKIFSKPYVYEAQKEAIQKVFQTQDAIYFDQNQDSLYKIQNAQVTKIQQFQEKQQILDIYADHEIITVAFSI